MKCSKCFENKKDCIEFNINIPSLDIEENKYLCEDCIDKICYNYLNPIGSTYW